MEESKEIKTFKFCSFYFATEELIADWKVWWEYLDAEIFPKKPILPLPHPADDGKTKEQ